jgi:hypothetical protein
MTSVIFQGSKEKCRGKNHYCHIVIPTLRHAILEGKGCHNDFNDMTKVGFEQPGVYLLSKKHVDHFFLIIFIFIPLVFFFFYFSFILIKKKSQVFF